MRRRQFLTGIAAAVGAVGADPDNAISKPRGGGAARAAEKDGSCGQPPSSLVDFRYSPKMCQHTFCFPEDPYKGVFGKRGDLR